MASVEDVIDQLVFLDNILDEIIEDMNQIREGSILHPLNLSVLWSRIPNLMVFQLHDGLHHNLFYTIYAS